jgi:hypothetical protein
LKPSLLSSKLLNSELLLLQFLEFRFCVLQNPFFSSQLLHSTQQIHLKMGVFFGYTVVLSSELVFSCDIRVFLQIASFFLIVLLIISHTTPSQLIIRQAKQFVKAFLPVSRGSIQ